MTTEQAASAEQSSDDWTAISYQEAMSAGYQALRAVSQQNRHMPVMQDSPAAQNASLRQQRDALQAAAWFAFARELREAGLG